MALYTLSTILKYSLSHRRPPESLLAHLKCLLLPKISMLVMHLSQNINHFVIWYCQPTFEHQESTLTLNRICSLLRVFLVAFGTFRDFCCIPVKQGALILPCICFLAIRIVQMQLVDHYVKARRKKILLSPYITTRKLIYGFVKL